MKIIKQPKMKLNAATFGKIVHMDFFVNVVYQALLIQGRCEKLVYKIFIANVVSMHLSAT